MELVEFKDYLIRNCYNNLEPIMKWKEGDPVDGADWYLRGIRKQVEPLIRKEIIELDDGKSTFSGYIYALVQDMKEQIYVHKPEKLRDVVEEIKLTIIDYDEVLEDETDDLHKVCKYVHSWYLWQAAEELTVPDMLYETKRLLNIDDKFPDWGYIIDPYEEFEPNPLMMIAEYVALKPEVQNEIIRLNSIYEET